MGKRKRHDNWDEGLVKMLVAGGSRLRIPLGYSVEPSSRGTLRNQSNIEDIFLSENS